MPDVTVLLDHFGSGGVERVACHVANGLQKRGFAVEMLVLEDSGPVRELLSPEVAVRALRHPSGVGRGDRMKAAVPAIAEYLSAECPRLFHAPGNHTIRPAAAAVRQASYQGAFVAKITNPVLSDRMSWLRRRRRRTMFARALGEARLVLVLSQEGARDVGKIDRSLLRCTRVVHNPYVSDAMIDRAGERRPADPPIILSIGRLSEQKNQALLIRAAARLRDRPWRLRLLGTGPDEDDLRANGDELRIADRLEMPGFVADPVPEYLAATVMALSSRWEGLPATLLEAMACGCPVVSTASSPGLVALMRELGAREPVAVDDEAGMARALAEALDGALPVVPPEVTRPFGIEAACDEHAALFAALLDREA